VFRYVDKIKFIVLSAPLNHVHWHQAVQLGWFCNFPIVPDTDETYDVHHGEIRWLIFTEQCTLEQSMVLRSHVVRPSVCPSVCNVGGFIGWKSWKLIAQTISPTPSLFVAKRRSSYSQGNMGEFGGEGKGGVGKSVMLENKSGNVSEMRKDR